MGYRTADLPPVDLDEFPKIPFLPRMKLLQLHWVEAGFGTPKQTAMFYVWKIFFFALFGLASGMPFSALTAITAELYGTRFLGEIKSVFLPVGVFASALSPMMMGVMIDQGHGLPTLMGFNIALAIKNH